MNRNERIGACAEKTGRAKKDASKTLKAALA